MNLLSQKLQRSSSGAVTLAALLVFILFSALVLPRQSRQSRDQSRQSRPWRDQAREQSPPLDSQAGAPDLSLFYSAGDLYAWADTYGEQGRQEYVYARFTFDVAWPLVYTFFLVTALSWLCARAFDMGSRWQLANLAPLLGMLFDFLENIATSLVMLRFPQPTPLVASLAGVFTLLKWGFIGASFALLVAALGVFAWRRLFHR